MEKKIEHSVEELWKLAEGTDTENKWCRFSIRTSKENRTSRELELVTFGDSITKYIIPENICKCDLQHTVNLSKSGAKVKGI